MVQYDRCSFRSARLTTLQRRRSRRRHSYAAIVVRDDGSRLDSTLRLGNGRSGGIASHFRDTALSTVTSSACNGFPLARQFALFKFKLTNKTNKQTASRCTLADPLNARFAYFYLIACTAIQSWQLHRVEQLLALSFF